MLDPPLFFFFFSYSCQNIYSCNEGNFDSWDEEIKRAVMGFKTESPPWAQRYVGSMVSDVHRTLLYGGLFLYPADKKSTKGELGATKRKRGCSSIVVAKVCVFVFTNVCV